MSSDLNISENPGMRAGKDDTGKEADAPDAGSNAGQMDVDYPEPGLEEGGEHNTDSDAEPASARVKAYLEEAKKKRQKKLEELKNSVQCDWLEYEAIQKKNREEMAAWDCDTGDLVEAPDIGSFISTIDGRIAYTGIRTSINQRRIVTTSFDINTWKCVACSGHEGPSIWTDRKDRNDHKEVIILSDQSYPPLLPVHGEQRCLRFIRVENGSIQTLTSELLSIGRGYTLGAGSMVLIFSAAHMATAGTAGYIEDLLAASAQIKSVLGQHVMVAPAPHLFMGGCRTKEVVRTCAEVSAWIDEGYGEDEGYLVESFRLANETLVAHNDDDLQEDFTVRIRLPTTNDLRKGKRCWVMGGFTVKKSIKPADSCTEAEILLSIIEEIRGKMAINLDPAPTFARVVDVPAAAVQEGKRYLVVGGNHAKNLAEAMRRKGDTADAVVITNWRATSKGVDFLVDKMNLAISHKRPAVIVLQILDENSFLTLFEDGTQQPAWPDKEGKLHVEGRLVVAKEEVLTVLLKLLEPVWKATEGYHTILMVPMLRYTTGSCCRDKDHLTNRMEPDFVSTLKKGLDEARLVFKRYMSSTGRSTVQMLDPNVDLQQLEKRHAWGADPVYPLPLAYDKMASGVKVVEAKIGKRRPSTREQSAEKRSRQEAAGGQPGTSRQWASHSRGARPSEDGWRPAVSGSNWRGRGRGHGGRRGGWQWGRGRRGWM
jgi:hypothetical protein